MILEIENLHARLAEGREILKGIDWPSAPGEVHAIMGPNGSGKSTLAGVLAGRAAMRSPKAACAIRGATC